MTSLTRPSLAALREKNYRFYMVAKYPPAPWKGELETAADICAAEIPPARGLGGVGGINFIRPLRART